MGVYYPQCAITLRVTWEDFGSTDAKLQETYTLSVLARNVTININDYTEADTFSAEIDYSNFPFDPRAIRACGITVHAEDMKRVYDENNRPIKIKPSDENTLFIGFADEESIAFDDTKKTVRLEGRDQTALLIDRKYLGGPVDLTKPIDVVITKLLQELIETQNLIVENRVKEALPILAGFYNSKDELSGKRNSKKDESYWDLIQNIIKQAGLVAYIELDRLVITKPRVLYSKENTKVFVYGSNIKGLNFKRKIGRRRNFNLIVRSLNVESKQVLEAKIPMEATNAWSKATGVSNSEVKIPKQIAAGETDNKEAQVAPYIGLNIPNVASKAQLIEIGQQVYEEIGRQQIEGSFGTKNMSIIFKKLNQEGIENKDGNIEKFDVLKLRNGTPISVIIESDDLKGIQKIDSKAEREKYLLNRGYDSKVAAIFSETMGKFSNIFYTKAVKFSFSDTKGIDIDVDFINFIETSEKFGGSR